jgi:hypothetical protein
MHWFQPMVAAFGGCLPARSCSSTGLPEVDVLTLDLDVERARTDKFSWAFRVVETMPPPCPCWLCPRCFRSSIRGPWPRITHQTSPWSKKSWGDLPLWPMIGSGVGTKGAGGPGILQDVGQGRCSNAVATLCDGSFWGLTATVPWANLMASGARRLHEGRPGIRPTSSPANRWNVRSAKPPRQSSSHQAGCRTNVAHWPAGTENDVPSSNKCAVRIVANPQSSVRILSPFMSL